MSTNEKPLHVRQAEGLRALADMIEANPEIARHAYYLRDLNVFHTTNPDDLESIARAGLRAGAKVEKNWSTETVFALDLKWGPVTVSALSPRDSVCERVVTGTEIVTKTVPDPDALVDLPTVEVTETVETVEWVCRPLLAAEAGSAVSK